jgi:hypothetical protein
VLIALPKLAHDPVAFLLRECHILSDRCLDAPVEEIQEPLASVRQFLLAERLRVCLEVFDRIENHLSEERQFLHHLGDSVPEAPSLATVLRALLLHLRGRFMISERPRERVDERWEMIFVVRVT